MRIPEAVPPVGFSKPSKIDNARCYVRVNGGFGNQLFQYAFARHLCAAHGLQVDLDVSAYYSAEHLRVEHQRLYLDRLNLPIDFVRLPYWRYEIARRLNSLPGGVSRALTGLEFRKEGRQPDPAARSEWNGIVMNGTWQRPDWFHGSSNTICSELRDGLDIPEGPTFAENVISLHVRRGDYLNVGYMALLNYEVLLENARQFFKFRLSASFTFLVFSDDPDWCQEALAGPDVDVFRGDSLLEDFRAMARCQHHVIANSSFSWWAAYLNPKPDKIVCAPARWHSSGGSKQIGILPPDWHVLADT